MVENQMPLIPHSLEVPQLSAASRLFSASVFNELARKGKSPLFLRLARDSTLLNSISHQSALVRDLFDVAFSVLKKKNYRHEYVYKSAITHKILLGRHSLQTSVMLNEFRAGKSKADVVILNGTTTVYEIKSERDKLARLPQQLSSYREVFAQVNIITGLKHQDAVLEIVPGDVGVLLLTDRFQISTIRKAVNAPERTRPVAIFDSIQLSEAKKILKLMNISIPKVPNTQMHQAVRDKFAKLTPLEAQTGMIEVLRVTRNLLPLSELLGALPDSLQAAALSTPIRKRDHSKLIEAMNTPLVRAMSWA